MSNQDKVNFNELEDEVVCRLMIRQRAKVLAKLEACDSSWSPNQKRKLQLEASCLATAIGKLTVLS